MSSHLLQSYNLLNFINAKVFELYKMSRLAYVVFIDDRDRLLFMVIERYVQYSVCVLYS